MNNSQIIEEFVDGETYDPVPSMRRREEKVTKIIEALRTIESSSEWQLLKKDIFDDLVSGLQKRLQTESEKQELNPPEIYRLNGQLSWARKYSDLQKLAETYKSELINLTKKLNENE